MMVERRWFERWLAWWRPFIPQAVVAILLLTTAGLAYYFQRAGTTIDRSLEAMRTAWSDSRPLEARVTGGFPHLPYRVTRGRKEGIAVNQNLLLATKADLAREVATKPRPEARQALGKLLLLESDFEKAQEELEAALRATPENAPLHVDLAALYYERGLLEQSPLLLERAAEHGKKATEISPKLPEAWFNLALCQEQRLLLTESRAAWEKYLELDPSSKWADEVRERLRKPPWTKQNVTEVPLKLSDELISALRRGERAQLEAALASQFIEVFHLAGGRFLDDLLQALDVGDRASAALFSDTLHRIARFSEERKDERSLRDMLDFLSRSQTSSIKEIRRIRELLRQAEQMHIQGHYDGALSLYSDARRAAEHLGDDYHTEAALYGLARIYSPQIETPDRLKLRETLVSQTAQRHHRHLQAKALLALANSYDAAQLLSKLLKVSSQAVEIARQLGDADTEINSLRFLGAAYAHLGDAESAIEINSAALQLLFSRPIGPIRACQVYSQMAEAFVRGGRPSSAVSYQIEAFQYCDGNTPESYSVTVRGRAGFYYSQMNRQTEALNLIKDAISRSEKYSDQTGQSLLQADLYSSLGHINLRQGQYEEAIRVFQTALKLVSRTAHYRYLAAVHEGLATAYRERGQFDKAEIELRESLKLAEKARTNIGESRGKNAFLNSRMNVYRAMMDFQYTVKEDIEQAFDFAEIYRNRELLDALSENAEIHWKQDQATLEYSGSVMPKTLKQVQKALPSEAQLVEYALSDRNLFIWLITSSTRVSKSVPIASSRLDEVVTRYLNGLSARAEIASLNLESHELYKLLIEPIADRLEKQRPLVIIPDGILHAIPFSALSHPDSNRYLLEDYTVITCPSASVLARTIEMAKAKRKQVFDSLLVVSNPKFNKKYYRALKPLLKSENEAERLRGLYAVSGHLNREQATERKLLEQMDRYDIVHFATHSLINDQNPLLSSIVLTAPKNAQTISGEGVEDDGTMSAYKVFSLKLHRTRLVILASCRSGLMAPSRSNGLGGLAHAFFSARVPTVIASLWEVDDESTSELMTLFHRHYREGKMGFSQSLRQAQLKLRTLPDRKWEHPYYWAAFTLSGDGFTG
ncbi:MAG: CHAT domain-containing protein [Blastocatellia bacterium]